MQGWGGGPVVVCVVAGGPLFGGATAVLQGWVEGQCVSWPVVLLSVPLGAGQLC